MRHFIKLTVLIAAGIILQAGLVHADWWSQNLTPVPSGASKILEEERMIGGSQQHLTYYVTDEDAAGVMDFYRKQLTDSNWNEVDLKKGMPNEITKALGNTLIFENSQERIVIVFPPKESFRDLKTRFTLSRGKIKEEPSGLADNQLLAKPKQDIAPVFPGAVLTNLIESREAQKSGYYCKNSLEEVAEFYKKNMILRGWRLESESPSEQLPMEEAKNMRMTLKRLIFSNSRDDSCTIGLSQATFGREIPDLGDSITNITVDYEAKL